MVGQTISHYRIVERLGGGGMGVVYAADDSRLGRRVALKFLPSELSADPQAVERFQREARAASALNDPHICTIHDIGTTEGADGVQHYIVMEMLEGETLKHHIKGRPLPIDEVIELGTQIADALSAAHAKGIVHRDIKPANVFVTRNGHAKVLDFGVAKLDTFAVRDAADIAATPTVTRALEPLTSPGAAIGTIDYMSPEQARGEEVDARSDLYALGLLLYEMTTGQAAVTGRTSALVFDAILHHTPAAPVRVEPSGSVRARANHHAGDRKGSARPLPDGV
jgi:serine/threonine protein kinase